MHILTTSYIGSSPPPTPPPPKNKKNKKTEPNQVFGRSLLPEGISEQKAKREKRLEKIWSSLKFTIVNRIKEKLKKQV